MRGFVPARNDEERYLMRHIEDLADAAFSRGIARYSAFLSDREQDLARAALGRAGVRDGWRFDGGWPEAERRVHEHARARVGFVEQARRVAQKHERELQPLGFVDAQDAHAAALAAGGGGLHTLGLLPLHPEQEAVQPARTRLFKLLRKIEQEQHIAPPQFAVRHRARERHDGAVVHDVPQKFAQRQLDRQRAVAREHVEKVPAVVARLGGERDGGVKIVLAVARAHGGQIVRRQAEQRRAQRRDERHILVRVSITASSERSTDTSSDV